MKYEVNGINVGWRENAVSQTYHADLDRDAQSAPRAGHSSQMRERDRENRVGAYRELMRLTKSWIFPSSNADVMNLNNVLVKASNDAYVNVIGSNMLNVQTGLACQKLHRVFDILQSAYVEYMRYSTRKTRVYYKLLSRTSF